jgi:hypothetical protein
MLIKAMLTKGMLLKLSFTKRIIPLTSTMNSMTLLCCFWTHPSPLQLNTEVFGVPTDGQALKAIGLGYTYANRTNLANDLMEVDLPKFNDESCKGIYYDYDYNIDTKTTVCAGGEQGEDICRGDSGNQHTSSIATTKPFSFV